MFRDESFGEDLNFKILKSLILLLYKVEDFLSVANDPANHSTDIVLLYNELLIGPEMAYDFFIFIKQSPVWF